MKTVDIALLVLAGALAGALVMKVVQHPARVTVRPAMATVAPPAAFPQSQATAQTKPSALAEAQAPLPITAPEVAAPDAAPDTAEQEIAPRGAVARIPQAERAPAHSTQPAHFTAKTPPPRRVPLPAIVAAPARAFHTPPRRVELATAAPASPPANSLDSAISSSPPLLPEQPKESTPARSEPENLTPAPAPVKSAPQPNQATLNAGMLIPVRLVDSLSPERNRAGDTFAATLDRELVASGFVVADRGARVDGRVTAADRDSHTLSLELISVHTLDNQDVPIQTERFDKQSEPDHSQAAAKIGTGVVLGAVIGGIAGGGKGAAIGAGAGGGISAGDVMLSRKAGSLPSETRLTFRLRVPVALTEHSQ